MTFRVPKDDAPEKPIDFSRGVFRLDGVEVVLIGVHVHEVKGRSRDKHGQKVVQISKYGRHASETEMQAARLARKAAAE